MKASVTIAEDSQWFTGHFPENPILPGIAQLQQVVELISSHCDTDLQLTGLSRVKFKKIIKPGELLNIQVTAADKKDQYMFQILSGNEDVCSGRISFIIKN
ncbi:MAG: hypothetical protein QNJ17_11465 [Desulfocapsaceae bacterium]|nr:hypothetical protein [Desulfocapsaceae bacterium]